MLNRKKLQEALDVLKWEAADLSRETAIDVEVISGILCEERKASTETWQLIQYHLEKVGLDFSDKKTRFVSKCRGLARDPVKSGNAWKVDGLMRTDKIAIFILLFLLAVLTPSVAAHAEDTSTLNQIQSEQSLQNATHALDV